MQWPCALAHPTPVLCKLYECLLLPCRFCCVVACAPPQQLSSGASIEHPGCLQVADAVLHDIKKKKKKAKLAAPPIPQRHAKEKGKAPVATTKNTAKVQHLTGTGTPLPFRELQLSCCDTGHCYLHGKFTGGVPGCRRTPAVIAAATGTPSMQSSAPPWRRTIGKRTSMLAAVKSTMMVSRRV